MGDDGFRNTFGDEQPLSDIHENENVFAFETYPISEINNANSSYEVVQILLVHIEKYSSTKRYVYYYTYSSCKYIVLRLLNPCPAE